MRLHRFFIEEPLRNKKEITLREDDLIHQLKDVFRLRSGDRLILLDNSGFEFLAEIAVLSKNGAEFKILETNAGENISKRDIWLFASLIKKDNFEWIVEKGTEIGVSHFVPVLSERSEKKDLNSERTLKIITEASEQSGRSTLPRLHDLLELGDIFTFATENNIKLVGLHLEGQPFNELTTEKANSLNLPVQPLGVLIGPEGGWSEREVGLFREQNVPMYTLGKQVLRAETAAIAVASLLLLK